MMSRKTIKNSVLHSLVLLLTLLILGGCGTQTDKPASLDPSSVTLQATAGLTANCNTLLRPTIGDEGGGHRTGTTSIQTALVQKNCSGVILDVSCTAIDADAVLLNIDGQEFSAEVDQSNGRFTARLALDSSPNAITITPMNGEFLGSAAVFDASKIVSAF